MVTETPTPQSELLTDGVSVVYITAQWCGPCKVYGPQVEKIADENPTIKFLKVDADGASDGLSELATKHTFVLRSVPSTLVFEDGELREAFVGNRIDLLTAAISKYSA